MIHATAIVDSDAEIADDVEIGPYSIIGPGVSIGQGSWIGPHVVINGPTRIGSNNRIFQFASIGDEPQDKKYHGEPTRLEIGDNNTIREYCTISRGTTQDKGITRVGSDNWIMAYVHIAHDCQVGSHTIFANAATLAGHVTVEDHVILGGFSAVHQFCRLGAHCFTAMASAIPKDIPPFVMASGNFAEPHGLNVEGLKRRGFDKDAICSIRNAYKILYKQGKPLAQAKEELAVLAEDSPPVAQMLQFIQSSERGIIR